jgi:cell division protein FtsQ
MSVSGRSSSRKAAQSRGLRPSGGEPARATRRPRPVKRSGGRLLRRLGPARVAAVLVIAALLGAGWLWLRDSSLVAVRHVEITGVSGPDSGRIRSALTAAAHTMTTLDLQRSRLQTAVAPYPAVKSIRVATEFPHGLRIHVVEELPSAILIAGGRRVLVSADGTVLRGATAKRVLPLLPARALPVGTRVTNRDNRQELAVLAAAPSALAMRAAGVLETPAHGIVVKLRAGPSLYFGTVSSLRSKWVAATAVLATPSSQGAAYIDLSDPSRPAAG